MAATYSHDVFISHASEDKDRFVRPLAQALRATGDVTVWYDEWELEVGDRLVERINDGLARSRFGVVVLSPAFFEKNWPRTELQALASLEMSDGRDRLLPIWLDLGADEIATYAPLLLGRVALKASDGVEEVAARLVSKAGGAYATPDATRERPMPPTLYPTEVAAQSLPNSYSPALSDGESGFVFRTVTALRMSLGPEAYLNSQQKRAFQAILSDSSVEGLVLELVDRPWARPSPVWEQALPNAGTVVTVRRPAETMGGRDGTIEARGGLLLRFYATGTAHAVVHQDLVLRPPAEMRVGSVLSLDDFYSLLLIPAKSVREEVAPVVAALLSGMDEPTLVAQSVVAVPQNDEFAKYLDLSLYAHDRVSGASGPYAVHWNATSASEIESAHWSRTVIDMIDRLFSDGSFLDYEHSLDRLAGLQSSIQPSA
jgi:hypothetical protein